MAAGGHFFKNIYKEVARVVSNRLLADYNLIISSLLVNISTDMYVGNEVICIVFAL